MAEDRRTGGKRGDDWLRQGGSRAEVKGQHEFWGDSNGPAWLTKRQGQSVELISEDNSTGVVDPRRLCQFLLDESLMRGVHFHQPARAVSVSKSADNEMTGVKIKTGEGAELDRKKRRD